MKKLFSEHEVQFSSCRIYVLGLRAAVYGQCLRKDWDAAEKMVLQMYSFRHGLEGLMYPGGYISKYCIQRLLKQF